MNERNTSLLVLCHFFEDSELKWILKDRVDIPDEIDLFYLGRSSPNWHRLDRVFLTKELARLHPYAAKTPNTLIYDFEDIFDSEPIEVINSFHLVCDRVFLKPISAWEKNFLLLDLVNFFASFISDYRKVSVAFFHTPHFPWDIALYVTCRLCGGDVYIMRKPAIDNTIFWNSTIGLQPRTFLRPTFSSDPEKILERCSNKSGYLQRSIRLNRGLTKSGMQLSIDFRKLRSVAGYIKGWCAPIISDSFYFNLSFIEFLSYKVMRVVKSRKARRWLFSHGVSIEQIDRPFVTFFMHFRPERTTIPEGGCYYDQYTAICALRRSIPADVQLLVKEHPRMLSDAAVHPDIRLSNFHFIDDYIRIGSLENVFFVKPDVESALLRSRSLMVSSITGSVLWESVTEGVPALSFSETWHSMCAASPAFDKRNASSTVMTLLSLSEEQVLEARLTFLSWFSEFCTDCIQDADTYKLSDRPDTEELINATASCLGRLAYDAR